MDMIRELRYTELYSSGAIRWVMSALCSVMAACWSVCTVIIAESMVLIADRSEANWSVETVGATVGATAEAARSCAGWVKAWIGWSSFFIRSCAAI